MMTTVTHKTHDISFTPCLLLTWTQPAIANLRITLKRGPHTTGVNTSKVKHFHLFHYLWQPLHWCHVTDLQCACCPIPFITCYEHLAHVSTHIDQVPHQSQTHMCAYKAKAFHTSKWFRAVVPHLSTASQHITAIPRFPIPVQLTQLIAKQHSVSAFMVVWRQCMYPQGAGDKLQLTARWICTRLYKLHISLAHIYATLTQSPMMSAGRWTVSINSIPWPVTTQVNTLLTT